jgi:hypothetical protein
MVCFLHVWENGMIKLILSERQRLRSITQLQEIFDDGCELCDGGQKCPHMVELKELLVKLENPKTKSAYAK